MLGTLLTAFRRAKNDAINEGTAELWRRNSPRNTKQKHNREIRQVVTSSANQTDIVIEMWEKIDTEHIRLTADVHSGSVTPEKVENALDSF